VVAVGGLRGRGRRRLRDPGPAVGRYSAVGSAILLLVTGLMYTLALRPRVVADGAGLTVVNPFRVHRIPWRLITSVDTAEWVRVRYRAGADDTNVGFYTFILIFHYFAINTIPVSKNRYCPPGPVQNAAG